MGKIAGGNTVVDGGHHYRTHRPARPTHCADPDRDPRVHTVSAVYIAEASGQPRAQDDARHLAIFAPDALPEPLAFDHARILSDYRRYRETGQITPLWSPTVQDQA